MRTFPKHIQINPLISPIHLNMSQAHLSRKKNHSQIPNR